MANTKFKEKTLKIKLDDLEESEEFLAGLILAQANNNSSYFPALIEGVNKIIQPVKRKLIEDQATLSAANANVSIEDDDEDD